MLSANRGNFSSTSIGIWDFRVWPSFLLLVLHHSFGLDGYLREEVGNHSSIIFTFKKLKVEDAIAMSKLHLKSPQFKVTSFLICDYLCLLYFEGSSSSINDLGRTWPGLIAGYLLSESFSVVRFNTNTLWLSEFLFRYSFLLLASYAYRVRYIFSTYKDNPKVAMSFHNVMH